MLRYVAGSRRAINLKWFLPSHNPRRQNQVREAESVIRMEVQPSDTFLASSRSLPNDPSAKVNEIGRTVDDDGGFRRRPDRRQSPVQRERSPYKQLLQGPCNGHSTGARRICAADAATVQPSSCHSRVLD